MPKKGFLRQESHRHLKLGRRKLRKWRKPKGRDSKMRLNRKSYPKSPTVGGRSPRKEYGRINGRIPLLIKNIRGLNMIKKDNVALIASVGAKKKLEIIKAAQEKKIEIININKEGKKNIMGEKK